MDKKVILQSSIRNPISEKNQRIKKERSFHIPLEVDHYGMIKGNIAGWMHIDEAKVLCESVVGRTHCLELGTHKGLSTSLIALANPHAKIITTEIFLDLTNQAKQNCKNLNNINFITTDSNDWLADCKTKFDWVFVDHCHDKDYMDVTMELLPSRLQDNHKVLLHDTHLDGVRSQLKKFKDYTVHRNLGIGKFW